MVITISELASEGIVFHKEKQNVRIILAVNVGMIGGLFNVHAAASSVRPRGDRVKWRNASYRKNASRLASCFRVSVRYPFESDSSSCKQAPARTSRTGIS